MKHGGFTLKLQICLEEENATTVILFMFSHQNHSILVSHKQKLSMHKSFGNMTGAGSARQSNFQTDGEC